MQTFTEDHEPDRAGTLSVLVSLGSRQVVHLDGNLWTELLELAKAMRWSPRGSALGAACSDATGYTVVEEDAQGFAQALRKVVLTGWPRDKIATALRVLWLADDGAFRVEHIGPATRTGL